MRITFLLLATLVAFSSKAQDREIEFHHDGWDKILAESKEKDQLIFLDAYASWCGPCKWMAANAFKDNAAADFYNQNFVRAKIDMEKGEGVDLAKKYGVRAYPTLIFIDHEGEVVHRSVGALDAAGLIELGKEALNPDMQLSTWDDKYAEGERSPEFIYGYLEMRSGAGYRENGDIIDNYFASIDKEAFDDELNWKIFYGYVWDDESKIFQHYFNGRKDAGVRKDSLYWKIGETMWRSSVPVIYSKEVTDDEVSDLITSIEESGFEESDKIIYKIRSTYTSRHKEWEDFEAVTIDGVEKYEWDNASRLNQLAWSYYENAESKKALENALKWAERSVELEKRPYNLDTKACLLFKLGKVKKAIKVEEEAIQLAEELGQDTKNYVKMLNKFKEES